MEILEHEIQSQCLEYLQANKIYCWRNNTGCAKIKGSFVRYGFVGSSDILGICPDGRFLAVECKRTNGGVLSKEQVKFLEKIKLSGGVAIVANSLTSLINQLNENKVKLLQSEII